MLKLFLLRKSFLSWQLESKLVPALENVVRSWFRLSAMMPFVAVGGVLHHSVSTLGRVHQEESRGSHHGD